MGSCGEGGNLPARDALEVNKQTLKDQSEGPGLSAGPWLGSQKRGAEVGAAGPWG